MLPMDRISLRVLARPEPNCKDEEMQDFPILPPHLLTCWLLERRLVDFDPGRAAAFWRHHAAQRSPWLSAGFCVEAGHQFEPYGLYGDEAEYTVSKEKVLAIFLSTLDSKLGTWF